MDIIVIILVLTKIMSYKVGFWVLIILTLIEPFTPND